MTPGQPQPQPDLNVELETPQIGDQIGVLLRFTDPKRLLSTQIVLPPALARQVAQGILLAADKAEKALVKPQSVIATA